MASFDPTAAAAVDAYRAAMNAGADKRIALQVALARMRARVPTASEWELRAALARALAAERMQAAKPSQSAE